MALAEIIAEIRKDAERRRKEILQEARTQAEGIVAEAKAKADADYSRAVAQGKEAAERHRRQRLQVAALEARKQVLAEKQRWISAAYEQALRRLAELPAEEYVGLLAGMLYRQADSGGGEVVLSPEEREKYGAEVVRRVNSRLEQEGKAVRFSLAEDTKDLGGGFVLRRGKVEVNCSFKAQLRALQDELEVEVAGILYGGG